MNETITFADGFARLRRVWWSPLLAAIAGMMIAWIMLARATPTYEASAILGPHKDFLGSGRGAGALGGLFGALQGNTANPDLTRFELVVRSDRLAQEVLRSPALTRALLVGRWDAERKAWKPRTGVMASILALTGFPLPDAPSADDIKAELLRVVAVETQQQSYRVVRLRTADPRRSQTLLDAIIHLVDADLRHDDQLEIDRMIAYTAERLRVITINQQVQAVASMLLNLEQQRIYVMASTNYSFDLIQQSAAETRPSQPKPVVYLAAGLVLPATLALALIVVWPRRTLRREIEN